MLDNDLRELLLKAIKAEKKLNLSNNGVIGGFNIFILNKLKNYLIQREFKDLKSELIKYNSLTKNEKMKLVKNLEKWLVEGKLIPEKKEKIVDKLPLYNTKTSLVKISGIGKKREKELKKLGLENIEDIFYYIPRRYEDRSNLKPIYVLEHGNTETILGIIKKVEVVTPKKNIKILKAYLENDTGKIAAIWFNQTFLLKKLKPGTKICVTGKIDLRFEKQIIVSEYEFIEDTEAQKHTGRIIPIYPLTESLTQKFMRNFVFNILDKYLDEIEEILPEDIRTRYELLPLKTSVKEIHFPSSWELLKKARYRLAFDEFLILQLGINSMKKKLKVKEGISHTKDDTLTDKLIQSLSFSLTNAQKKAILDIKNDMEKPKIMYRLIQGDVGSGKTVVAAWALVKAINGGFQSVLMAPTEILAEQHYLTFKEILSSLNIEPVLLKGNMPKKEKEFILNKILTGEIKLVIGTHALIQSEVVFDNLGLIVIDEQHRFGVKQRLALQQKGIYPDVLVMSATPIPRTLALTLYGDMDLSIINELPPGRKEIRTYHVNDKMRKKVYDFIRKEVKKGQQVYIVCPLVEESEKIDVENATNLANYLQKEVFPEFKIEVLHGRMSEPEKDRVMEEFRKEKVQILVSTTVIEVGVNVPNATIMVIENAERFGLAQLHQLRGRVGRGTKQGYCFLISEPKTNEGKARMKIMTETSNGFIIAEEDLKLRGPGEILGTKQHGLPELKVADLVKDLSILRKAKKLAENILNEGFQKPKYKNLYETCLKKFKNTDIFLS